MAKNKRFKKKNKEQIINFKEYRYSSDEWYPKFENSLVKVGISFLPNGDNVVNVWGADDDGMELWSKDKELIKDLFRKICSMEDIKKKELEKLGLKNR